ncbi:helix-turn-helix transcriptional regulator [Streptomyces sp. DSM 44917]|uniref:Helix-turn-helix transcriptional regulator n=1 Tax=Streptomyces boetiae TaxID=3075541 RepID=A0ABU2L6J3_9ACTN|nr:helix-turn-helix transcriptional regulator [Streptomyces sp. DSM 44917]MDT0306943.1 helix-turn-helix transcriptional regulator [Streptomyces sp. DSM 44917]
MSQAPQQDLGRALRALRQASGHTGAAVARRASMSAAKLSKIENGRVLPSVADVEFILTALEVGEAAKADFLTLARAAAVEATAWRELRRTGHWKHQEAIRAIEKGTTVLRLFQGQLIPGLLQTPDYMSAVFSLPPGLTEAGMARSVATRLTRQAVLHEKGRTFHFLICEHVLRWRVCGPAVMAAQLDRLISLSHLPNVTIGILPLSRPMPDFPMNCFSAHDDRLVIVETFHAEITTRNPRDVALYLATFASFDSVALHGNDMRRLLTDIREEFFRQQESD